MTFQDFFVREQCKPDLLDLRYDGLDNAGPTALAQNAIAQADLIVIAPSNPLVSIAPILGIGDLRAQIGKANAPVFSVSPLIAGKVVKGPADRMMTALGHRADAVGIAEIYSDIADAVFIDTADEPLVHQVSAVGPRPYVTDILIPSLPEKTRLAQEIVTYATQDPIRGAA